MRIEDKSSDACNVIKGNVSTLLGGLWRRLHWTSCHKQSSSMVYEAAHRGTKDEGTVFCKSVRYGVLHTSDIQTTYADRCVNCQQQTYDVTSGRKVKLELSGRSPAQLSRSELEALPERGQESSPFLHDQDAAKISSKTYFRCY